MKWTKEDDDFLTDNYPKYGVKYCMTQLKRTKRSIELRCRKLKLYYDGVKSKYHKDNLVEVIKQSYNYSDCLKKLGINNLGSSYNTLKKYIEKYEIDITHFRSSTDSIFTMIKNNIISLEEILVVNSTYTSSHRLKNRLYNVGLKERKCELCGQGEEWNGKKMSLILDHINGKHNDNRINNLRIVCPNCNATLETHCRGYKK
jgi:hypothetical protein